MPLKIQPRIKFWHYYSSSFVQMRPCACLVVWTYWATPESIWISIYRQNISIYEIVSKCSYFSIFLVLYAHKPPSFNRWSMLGGQIHLYPRDCYFTSSSSLIVLAEIQLSIHICIINLKLGEASLARLQLQMLV